MEAVRKMLGMYLVMLAMVVAVWFIINTLFLDMLDPTNVWFVLDILMLIGLVVGLLFNLYRKRAMDSERSQGDGITQPYLEANILFYATAAVFILFMHNWIAFLKIGLETDNHQAWVIWAVVDTLLPLVLGVTGCAMVRHNSAS